MHLYKALPAKIQNIFFSYEKQNTIFAK